MPRGLVPGQDQDEEEAAWDTRLAAGTGEDDGRDHGWDDGRIPDDPDAAGLAGVPCPDEPPDLGVRPDDPAQQADTRNNDARDGDGRNEDGESRDDGSEDHDGQDGTGGGGPGGGGLGPGGCGGAGDEIAACGKGLAANVDLIVPLADLAGYAQRAAVVRNLGGIDPELARTLVAMAARDPGSVFRVIITGPDGCAAAFGQASPVTPATRPAGGRHTGGTPLPFPSLGLADDPPDDPGMPLASFTPAPGSRNRVTGQDGFGLWRLRIGRTVYTVRLDPVPGPGPCAHDYRGAGYTPGPVLRRLAEVRDGACMLPGCNRSPRRSESEHCQPWPAGETCSCNLGLSCKKHNLMKKDPNWQVTQKPDGTRTWTTPGGLRYTKTPKTYPS